MNGYSSWVFGQIAKVHSGHTFSIFSTLEFANANPVPGFLNLGLKSATINTPPEFGPVVFDKPYKGTQNALPELVVPIVIKGEDLLCAARTAKGNV